MRARGLLPIWLLLGVLMAITLGAVFLASLAYNSYIHYDAPLPSTEASASGALPAARPSPPLTDRIVLVVVDGLRYDSSLTMPFLNELRHQGIDFVSEVGEPALSFPGWTAIASGAGPELSGVTTNWYRSAVKVDTIFASAHRAGLKTAVVGAAGWGSLFLGQIDVARYSYSPDRSPKDATEVIPGPRSYFDDARNISVDEDIARGAAIVWREAMPNLLVIHFLGPDQFGHARGAASPEYAADIARVDALLRRLVAVSASATASTAPTIVIPADIPAGAIDLSTTTLIVTSDHGQLARGGHGGTAPEVVRTPLVLVGKGAANPRAGSRVPARADQRDIAPTVAVLLGSELPAQSQGKPLYAALALPAAGRAGWGVEVAARKRTFAREYARLVGAEPASDDLVLAADTALKSRYYAESARDSDEALSASDLWLASAREDLLTRDREARAPVALVALALPLAYAILARPRSATLLALPVALSYTIAFWAVYMARGYTISIDTVNTEANARPFVVGRGVDTLVILLLIAVAAGLAYHRAGPRDVARLAARGCFWIVCLLAWQIAAFYLLFGFEYHAYLPASSSLFKLVLDVIQIATVGVAGPLVVAVAAGISVLARRSLGPSA